MDIRKGRAIAVAGALLALAAGASADLIKKGKPAPAWSGKRLDGKMISSSQLKGRVLLLNFFSYS